jgi:endoglucanase
MKDMIEKLAGIQAPSGSEENLTNVISKLLAPIQTTSDFMGNLLVKKESAGPKILAMTSIDHDSIVVNYIDDKGYIRFYPSSGLHEKDVLGRQIIFMSGITGIVGTEDLADGKPQFSKMFIDIGAKDKASAAKHIAIGEHACLPVKSRLEGDRLVAGANGNITSAILAYAIKEIETTPNNLVFAFATQGKIGGRGAMAVMTGEKPDLTITVDLYPATDTPNHPNKVKIELEEGPVLVIADSYIYRSKTVVDSIKSVANSSNIPLQIAISDRFDTKDMRVGMAGVANPMVSLCLPARQYGEGIVCSLKDAQNLAKLLAKVVVKKLIK